MGSAAAASSAKYIIIIIDNHSLYVWANATKHNDATTTIDCLNKLIYAGLKPESLITDNGTNYTALSFKKFLASHDIRHLRISPHHPQSNGMCERVNGTIKNRLRLLLKPFN